MAREMKNLVIFSILGAIWRRWYGGGFGRLGDITRALKYAVLFALVFWVYASLKILNWSDWRPYAVAVAFAYHWARSHGDYFYVYDTGKDEGRIKWIDWLLKVIYGEGKYYNFKGNVTGLFCRYTSTSCIVAFCIPNVYFVFAGLLTAGVYALTGKMKRPIVIAEFLSGLINFALLYLCLIF